MIALLILFVVIGAVLLAVGSRLGRGAFLVGALAPAATVGWVVLKLGDVIDGRIPVERVAWVPELDLWFDLRLDGFAATMTLIIAVVGVLVFAYAAGYFSIASPDLGRLSGLLVLFAGAMVGLVLADQLIVLYVFWEITAVTSYLLIGTDYTDANARAAALHALLVTGAGGLAMLGGFVILGQAAGTYRLSALAAAPDLDGTAVTVALVLVLFGAFTKSAQYPFHAWLPAAMAAPTPVSAYLHSATMVTAGVYLVARLTPVFASTDLWRPAVLTVGSFTLIAGGLRALHQHDLKRLLAFGTVSQLGLMMVLFGTGTPAGATAGWVLLVAHAAFKAALFMVVGILDRQTGTRDVRTLPALRRGWWWVDAVALVSVISMAGVPLGLGFVAKESAYEALLHAPFSAAGLVVAAVVAGSMLTVAYSARFYLGAFVAPRRRARSNGVAGTDRSAPAPAWSFVAPAALLAIVGIVLGVAPGLEDELATVGIPGYPSVSVDLELWHGWNLALALSALTLAGGAVLVALDPWVQRTLAVGRAVPSAQRAYLGLLRGVGEGSRRFTGVVQNGSLPVYAGVILATAAILPVAVAATSWDWTGWPAVIGPVSHVPIVAVLVAAALGAAKIRRRFSAALLLGAVGYAMAALFVAYGAPDLALTQAAIETLSTVLFVLVLRRLPRRFERQSTSRRRFLRLAIAGLVGATVFVFAIAASGTRIEPPFSPEIVERAVPDGGGRNVVNVILVDFRSLDTLGEITVLVAASIGAVALARVGRRVAEEQGDRRVTRPAVKRIVFVDVSAQLLFHAVLMASLWLLFAGHNQPGGGFVAGLLAGSAIALRYIAGGMAEVRSLSRFRPWTVLGVGLLIAGITATLPLLTGNPVLDVATWTVDLPLAGAVKISSALVFDVGVYITVIGMVLMVFEAFGDEPTPARP